MQGICAEQEETHLTWLEHATRAFILEPTLHVGYVCEMVKFYLLATIRANPLSPFAPVLGITVANAPLVDPCLNVRDDVMYRCKPDIAQGRIGHGRNDALPCPAARAAPPIFIAGFVVRITAIIVAEPSPSLQNFLSLTL
eukprot:scaffold77573_cov27-Tisochrysis_lutea.AAC.3